jgi:hypothetical protein
MTIALFSSEVNGASFGVSARLVSVAPGGFTFPDLLDSVGAVGFDWAGLARAAGFTSAVFRFRVSSACRDGAASLRFGEVWVFFLADAMIHSFLKP